MRCLKDGRAASIFSKYDNTISAYIYIPTTSRTGSTYLRRATYDDLTDLFVSRQSHLVNFQEFHALSTIDGIGFRVVATGFNNDSLSARDVDSEPSWKSVKDHLQWRRCRTPWLSIFSSWKAALQRCWWYAEKGATRIKIIAVDSEKIRNVLSASSLAWKLQLPKSWFYTYEYLVWRGIPDEAVVGMIPATGETLEMDVDLGVLKVPTSLVRAAGDETQQAIRAWAEKEVWRWTRLRDPLNSLRLMQSMCIRRDDDVSDLYSVGGFREI